MPVTDSRPGALVPIVALLTIVLALTASTPAQPAEDADPAVGAIRFYQRHLSSLRHLRCRFTPSCAEYAAQAIARFGLAEGSARAADRLMRCNASAAGFYPRLANGTLDDPVDAVAVPGGAFVPAWLLPMPEPGLPPLADTLGSSRRERIAETVAFALELEEQGDSERAAIEFQRAGSLAGGPEARRWAFARAGQSQLAARRWPEAERSFLTAGMLARSERGRARAAYLAAVSRFDAGSFAACERMLSAAALPESDRASAAEIGADRVATLRGLCAMGRGDWPRVARELAAAAARAEEPGTAARIRLLSAFVVEGPRLPHRSPALAGALSTVLPGAGQAYAGRPRDGLRHLIFDAAMIATVISFARHDEAPAAYVAGTFAFPFYVGNILGASDAARRHDRLARTALLARAVRESAR